MLCGKDFSEKLVQECAGTGNKEGRIAAAGRAGGRKKK